jgi:hypothetical protein
MTHRNDLVPSDAVAITTSNSDAKRYVGLYVGGSGDVVMTTAKGNDVTFTAVPAGTIIPITFIRIKTTSTATNMVGFTA